MKISPITNKINFGYKFPNQIEQTTYDGDDLSCQEDRKFIRERLFANFPYNEEHQEYRLDPNALKYLIIDVTKTRDIDEVSRRNWAKREKIREQEKESGFYTGNTYRELIENIFSDVSMSVEEVGEAISGIVECIETDEELDRPAKIDNFNEVFEAIIQCSTFSENEKDLFADKMYKKLEELEENQKEQDKLPQKVVANKTLKSKSVVCNSKLNFELLRKELNTFNRKCISDEVQGYRGSMDLSKYTIDVLKRAGIKTIIDLRGGEEKQIDGIKHFTKLRTTDPSFYHEPHFQTKESYVRTKINKFRRYGFSEEELKRDEIRESKNWEESKANFVNTLVEFVDLVNQGCFYMGCEFGTESTSEAIALNNAINPEAELIGYTSDRLANNLLILLGNLNENDKQRLGLTSAIYQEKIKYLTECSESKY